MINLSPEKPRVFGEIVRVLKPGGRMLISDTLVRDIPGWLRWLSARVSGVVAVLLDEEAYLDGMRASGLADLEIKERTVFAGPRLRRMLTAEVGRFQRRERGGWSEVPAVAERMWLAPILSVGQRLLRDKVSSIKVLARKP